MAKLYFYYASMNAGKSTVLLQTAFNYRERGMETMLWTAAVHDRSGFGIIDSRIGQSTAQANAYEPRRTFAGRWRRSWRSAKSTASWSTRLSSSAGPK